MSRTWLVALSVVVSLAFSCSKEAPPPQKAKPKPVKPKPKPEVPGEVLARAGLVLDRDPTLAMAWLRRFAERVKGDPEAHRLELLDAWIMLAQLHARGRGAALLRGHEQQVTALAFSGDGKLLASGDGGGVVRLWRRGARVAHGQLSSDAGKSKAISALTFSPDRQTLAAAQPGGLVLLWNLGDDGPRPRELRPGGEATRLSFSADSAWLWVHLPEGPRALSVSGAGGPDASTPAGKPPRAPASAPAPSWQITAREDGALEVASQGSGAPARQLTLRGHKGRPGISAASPDGHWLASAGLGGEVRLWRVGGDALERTVTLAGGDVRAALITGDGGGVVVMHRKGKVCVHDPAGKSRRCLPNKRRGKRQVKLGASRDGKWLLVRSGNRASVWSLSSGSLRSVAVELDELAAISPKGDTLALSTYDGELMLRTTATAAEIRRSRDLHPGSRLQEVYGVTYSPNGTRLVTARRDGSVQMWKANDLSLVGRAIMGGVQPPDLPTFTLDDEQMVVGERSGRVAFWDSHKATLIRRAPRAHTGRINAIAFSTDETLMATAGEDRKLVLWDLASRKPRPRSLATAAGPCADLGFAADGASLICVTSQGKVTSWDLRPAVPAAMITFIDAQTNLRVDRDGKTSLK